MNMTMRGVLVVAVAAAVSGYVFSWPDARADNDGRMVSGAATRDAAWAEECGACHVAYPPQLLPAASWTRIMDGLADHFGENAELPADTANRIRAYLVAHAADARGLGWGYDGGEREHGERGEFGERGERGEHGEHGERGAQLGGQGMAGAGFDAPLRITETRWFMKEHDEISAAVWKRESVGSPANCAACHKGAETGRFDEHGVRIPK